MTDSSARLVLLYNSLASICRMGPVAVISSPSRWLERIFRRDTYAGIGYALAVTSVLMIGWDLEDLITDALEKGVGPALESHGKFFLFMMLHQYPTLPLLAAAVNLAPSSTWKRVACLTAVWIVMWGFCTFLFYFEGQPTTNLDYAFMLVLIILTCVYRSSARSANSKLIQTEVEGADLDAEVKRARLQLLRAQIEPHFLFNTLATVRTLARIEPRTAVEMLDHLIRYLSEALPAIRQEEASLGEELRLIEAYLRIHQIRMGTRLAYEFLVPEFLIGERIPTMVLLTLVENAVKHGINPAVHGGLVRVTATRERESLVLRVSDSGQGMATTDGHGLGLANIRRRLSMLYGDGAMLSLARASSQGVTATVSIPMAAAS